MITGADAVVITERQIAGLACHDTACADLIIVGKNATGIVAQDRKAHVLVETARSDQPLVNRVTRAKSAPTTSQRDRVTVKYP